MDPTRATNQDTTPDTVDTERRGVTTSSNRVMVGTTSNRATMPTNSRVSTVPSNRDMVVTVTTRATDSSKDTANNSKDTANSNRGSSRPVSRATARLLKVRTGSNKDTVSSNKVRTVPNKGMDNNSRDKPTRVTRDTVARGLRTGENPSSSSNRVAPNLSTPTRDNFLNTFVKISIPFVT